MALSNRLSDFHSFRSEGKASIPLIINKSKFSEPQDHAGDTGFSEI